MTYLPDELVPALAHHAKLLMAALEHQGAFVDRYLSGPVDNERDLAALRSIVELRTVLDSAEAHVVGRAQRRRSWPRVSDAQLARALGVSTSAFSRRYGRDTLAAQGNRRL